MKKKENKTYSHSSSNGNFLRFKNVLLELKWAGITKGLCAKKAARNKLISLPSYVIRHTLWMPVASQNLWIRLLYFWWMLINTDTDTDLNWNSLDCYYYCYALEWIGFFFPYAKTFEWKKEMNKETFLMKRIFPLSSINIPT